MSKKYPDVLRTSEALLFFEEKAAPISVAGYRLPFTVDVSQTFAHPHIVREIAGVLAEIAKDCDVKRVLALSPVMRPFATFAAEIAHLPFCEFDARALQVIGAGGHATRVMLLGDVAIGNNYGQTMITALEKQSCRVTDVVFLVDVLTKGDEYEIARRKWLLRENVKFHALLPLADWFRDSAKQKTFSIELTEHCIQYLHNPKRLSKDPLWWMKYHELLARNRII